MSLFTGENGGNPANLCFETREAPWKSAKFHTRIIFFFKNHFLYFKLKLPNFCLWNLFYYVFRNFVWRKIREYFLAIFVNWKIKELELKVMRGWHVWYIGWHVPRDAHPWSRPDVIVCVIFGAKNLKFHLNWSQIPWWFKIWISDSPEVDSLKSESSGVFASRLRVPSLVLKWPKPNKTKKKVKRQNITCVYYTLTRPIAN